MKKFNIFGVLALVLFCIALACTTDFTSELGEESTVIGVEILDTFSNVIDGPVVLPELSRFALLCDGDTTLNITAHAFTSFVSGGGDSVEWQIFADEVLEDGRFRGIQYKFLTESGVYGAGDSAYFHKEGTYGLYIVDSLWNEGDSTFYRMNQEREIFDGVLNRNAIGNLTPRGDDFRIVVIDCPGVYNLNDTARCKIR